MLLQGLKADQRSMRLLRYIVHAVDSSFSLSRIDDNRVIAQMVSMIDKGQLRLCGNKADAKQEDNTNPKEIAAAQVLVDLQKRSQNFPFEGRILRFTSVKEYKKLVSDGQYQVIAKDEAQKIIDKMMAAPLISAIEKNSLKNASDLIPDTRLAQLDSGLLLLRHTPSSAKAATSSGPVVAPSQLAPKQAAATPPAAIDDKNTFSGNADVLAIANSMKDAAKNGIPFCEECAKAAMQEAAMQAAASV
jgi:anti-sigma28 factor (negative regulator of flagellin synthesis)